MLLLGRERAGGRRVPCRGVFVTTKTTGMQLSPFVLCFLARVTILQRAGHVVFIGPLFRLYISPLCYACAGGSARRGCGGVVGCAATAPRCHYQNSVTTKPNVTAPLPAPPLRRPCHLPNPRPQQKGPVVFIALLFSTYS